MNTMINRDFFKFTSAVSEGFNNLCTIIHPVIAEGQYTGHVYLQGSLLGSFSLTSDQSSSDTQAQIDVSSFDHISQVNLKAQVTINPSYTIGKGGYMLLFASGPQNGFYVTLSSATGGATNLVFDTRDLNPGDLMIFRPITPGNYVVTNTRDNNTAAIAVQSYPDHQYPNPSTLPTIPMTLTAAGFNPAAAQLSPLQALVITIGAPASLTFSTN